MKLLSPSRAALISCLVLTPIFDVALAAARDLWVHPRNATFDPGRHYRAPSGEVYFRAENDIGGSLGRIFFSQRDGLSIELGDDLFQVTEARGGSLQLVLLYDSDGDDEVDRAIGGRIEDRRAIFDSQQLGELDLERTRWQLGVVYSAGELGDPELNGRYLASIQGSQALITQVEEELPQVASPTFPPGLVILKHREGAPFDLAGFMDRPSQYLEYFDPLTRADDGDDWSMDGSEGRLRTHFAREDLFFVRTEGDATLQIEWGDMPLESFAEEHLGLQRNDDCYSSPNTGLKNHDGTPTVIPHRLHYCPDQSFALFDAPDGYQINLSALRGGEPFERTEAGTSIPDNIRLYAHEIYPRHPSQRGTGSVFENIRAGFADAGEDLKDAFRHGFVGAYEPNIHTGQIKYRVSPFTGAVTGLASLVQLQLFDALDRIVTGAESAIQFGADAVSAVDNAVINPLLQVTVGTAVSPDAADTAGDWFGALTQAVVKNLPAGERFNSAVSPQSLWRHNRAFAETRFTRTDTQLNIDRAMTTLDLFVIGAINNHNDDSGGASAQGGPGGPTCTPQTLNHVCFCQIPPGNPGAAKIIHVGKAVLKQMGLPGFEWTGGSCP